MGKINDLIQHGLLDEAIAECIRGVKSNPSDVSRRACLYELSALCGNWERCVNQLETIIQLGGDALHWAAHMANIHSEKSRTSFWKSSDAAHPPLVGDDDYASEIADSLIHSKKSGSQFHDHFEEFGQLDFGSCIINGDSVMSVSFVDSRLTGFFEASEQGEYVWIYAGGIQKIECAEPAGDLTRLLWIPAKITFADGTIRVCTLFGLYPESFNSSNNMVRLGRDNEWDNDTEGLNIGYGPVLLTTNDAVIPLTQIRTLDFAINQDLNHPIA